MKRLCLMICVFGLILSGVGTAEGAIYDDFEDGVIDTDLWVTGGAERGFGWPNAGIYQWSHEEVIAEDGYIRERVNGPATANTYGSEAWIRTVYNFNDGKDHLINFTWSAQFNPSSAGNVYAIQITNGEIPEGTDCWWYLEDYPQNQAPIWTNLYFRYGSPEPMPLPPTTPTTWSILVNSVNQTATLYFGPNLTGPEHRIETLDPSHPWYLRFILSVASAAGYPPGDNSLSLYHFVARPLEEGTPPVADAGDDIIANANEEVTLDGSNSSDPDGEIIRYTWKRLPDEVVIYSGEEPNCQTRALGRAEEVIELTVTDNYLATATDTVRIVSRTTQDLKDQVAAMQSQIEELQRQIQELQALVDKIVSWPPVKQWLRRSTDGGD